MDFGIVLICEKLARRHKDQTSCQTELTSNKNWNCYKKRTKGQIETASALEFSEVYQDVDDPVAAEFLTTKIVSMFPLKHNPAAYQERHNRA